MIPLDVPPKLWVPEPPQIIRPVAQDQFSEVDRFLARKGVSSSARKAIVRELLHLSRAPRSDREGLKRDLCRFAGLSIGDMDRAGTLFLPFVAAAGGATVYPSVVNTNSAIHSTANPYVVNLPASIVAGQLLMVAVATVENAPTGTPAGWTQLASLTGSSQITLTIYYKVAAGGEGATLNVASAGIRTASSVSWSITDYQGTPEVTSTAHSTGASPDPGTITPSWGSDDMLVIPVLGVWGTQTISSYPASYTNGTDSYQSSGLSNRVAWCRREVTGTSENPGAFTLSGTVSSQKTVTIAIRAV